MRAKLLMVLCAILLTSSSQRTTILQNGNRIPDFSYTTLEGISISRDSLLGRYWLLEFWASWCLPCRKQNPHLNDLLIRLQEEDSRFEQQFGVIGFSLDRDTSAWRKAIINDDLDWSHQICDTLFWKGPTAKTFDFTYMPYNILIDHKGIIRAQGLYGKGLEIKLRELLSM